MSTFEKVRDITVEQLSVDADEVKMESSFIDDLGADSLDIVELKCWMKKNNLLAAQGKALRSFP